MVIASLIALVCIAGSLIIGFRRGFLRSLPLLIGVVCGIICAHIFATPLRGILLDLYPRLAGHTESEFIISNLSAGIVFLIISALFFPATLIVSRAFRRRELNVFDGIAGALASLFVTLIFLSLIYNGIVCINPHNSLMKSMRHGDGNIVHSVMMVAPVVLGGQTPEELGYLQQLDEARTIS